MYTCIHGGPEDSMIHYIITLIGDNLEEIYNFLSEQTNGIVTPICHHGNVEVIIYVTTLYPIAVIEWLAAREIDYRFEVVKR
jgi:hypothetical protein